MKSIPQTSTIQEEIDRVFGNPPMVHACHDKGVLVGHAIFCPACRCCHLFAVDRWKFNGNREKPTFTPSYRDAHCHCSVEDGFITFHDDSPNGWRGKFQLETP